MHNNFKILSEIIYKEKAFSKIVARANEQEIVDQFGRIFPELAKVAEAVKVEKNILYLRVENSVWRSELNIKQDAIIKKIKLNLRQSEVKKIKFIS